MSSSAQEIMSQNAVNRLCLMQVGSMPEYEIPIVCYLVQTDDGKHILIASGEWQLTVTIASTAG